MNNSADLLKELRIDRKAPSRESPSGRGWGIAIATLVVVIVLLLGLAAWWWWLGRARPLQVRTVPVVAISAGSTSSSVLDASGYVVARRIATVSAQVTGKVLQVMIEEGMRVEAGQVMATLDPIETNAQREVGAAQLAAARSQVQNVQAQLVVAEADAMRLQSLVGEQLVSRSQYDQAMSQRDALRAQLQVAQRNVAVATHELSLSDIHVDFTVVRAPFAGVVTAKRAAGRDRLAAGHRRFHPHRHDCRHGFVGSGSGGWRGLHRPRAAEDAGRSDPRRLSRLAHPGQGDRDHPGCRPRQGHSQGARGA